MTDDVYELVRVGQAMDGVKPLFKVWYENLALHGYLLSIESAVRACTINEEDVPTTALIAPSEYRSSIGYVSISRLFDGSAPDVPPDRHTLDLAPRAASRRRPARHKSSSLEQMIKDLGKSTGRSKYKKGYVEDLENSLNSLHSRDDAQAEDSDLDEAAIVDHLKGCQQQVDTTFAALVSAVTAGSTGALLANQFPRLSPLLFLSQLSHDRWATLKPDWRAAITKYGVALTMLQRAQRMLHNFHKGLGADLMSELQNPGHRNWDPLVYPESLLIEVEGGIMIRDVQESIAAEMRSPQDGENATMQLNMGQGKSSLIVPIVACALANGSQLVRILVAKPQSKQAADMLKTKLGAAVNRRVYYMPFSRSLKLDQAAADTVYDICRGCMQNNGGTYI